MQNNQDILQSPETKLLQIPTRLQWENANGYCGEMSVQCCSIYYGNYISQDLVRKIAGSQFLIGQNAEKAVQALNYQMQTWEENKQGFSQEQGYKNYLLWIKSNISQGYPVIIAGYQPQGKQAQYDHIYMAVGVHSSDFDSEDYNADDKLIYMSLFDPQYQIVQFSKVWDTRKMNRNGRFIDFAIPKQNNFGIAVKGLKDDNQVFLPMRLIMDENNEPNVSIGQQAKDFNIQVCARQLNDGQEYVILRYNDYKKIPKNNVFEKQADTVHKFTANGDQYQYSDVINSHSMAFYRCVKAENLE